MVRAVKQKMDCRQMAARQGIAGRPVDSFDGLSLPGVDQVNLGSLGQMQGLTWFVTAKASSLLGLYWGLPPTWSCGTDSG